MAKGMGATMNTVSALLTDEQAGAYLHVHPRTLANWAYQGRGPSYSRLGRSRFYQQSDLDLYVESRRFPHMVAEREARS